MWLSGYTHRKRITIDQTKIDATLTDFTLRVSLPAATISGKELYLGCIYNSTSSKWEVLALAIE